MQPAKITRETNRISKSSALLLIALCIALPLSFGEVYFRFHQLIDQPLWMASLLVNAPLALLVFYLKRFSSDISHRQSDTWLRRLSLSLVVLLPFLWLLVFFGRSLGNPPPLGPWPRVSDLLIFVVAVPLSEELAFRLGLGDLLKRKFGLVWGTYGSVFIFCYLHSLARWSLFPELPLALPLGVLLLSALSEALLHLSASIWRSVVLHASLNFTAIYIGYMDARWIDALSILFLKIE